MNKKIKIFLYGIILWLVPFFAGFPFVDAQGNVTISETFFKTIMIIVSGVIGVALTIRYFKCVSADYVREGITIGIIWLAINWAIDLVLVYVGFFPMTITKYFTDIGLRYLVLPMYTTGVGYALKQKK